MPVALDLWCGLMDSSGSRRRRRAVLLFWFCLFGLNQGCGIDLFHHLSVRHNIEQLNYLLSPWCTSSVRLEPSDLTSCWSPGGSGLQVVPALPRPESLVYCFLGSPFKFSHRVPFSRRASNSCKSCLSVLWAVSATNNGLVERYKLRG